MQIEFTLRLIIYDDLRPVLLCRDFRNNLVNSTIFGEMYLTHTLCFDVLCFCCLKLFHFWENSEICYHKCALVLT